MKLIIRDDKSKEETCEFWVEKDGDRVRVMSRSGGDKSALTEVSFYPDMTAVHYVNANFKWDTK